MPTTSEVQLSNGQRVRALRQRGMPGILASFSVPRWLRGDNRQPATSDELRSVVDEFVDLLAEHVHFASPVPTVRVRRLDIARDFVEVPMPAQILNALSLLRSDRRMTTSLYRDAGLVGAQTVYRANTRWKARIYHRAEMYRDAARSSSRERCLELASSEDGVLRLEFELRSEILSELGLTRVESIDDRRLWSTASKYWDRSGFGGSIGSDHARLARARCALSIQELGLLTVFTMFPGTKMARNTERKARALSAAYGVTRDDFLRATGTPAGRLDLPTGTFAASGGSDEREAYGLAV